MKTFIRSMWRPVLLTSLAMALIGTAKIGIAYAADGAVPADLMSMLPLWLVPWITGAIAVASVVVAHIPQPEGKTWTIIWAILNLVAHNVHLAAPPPPNPSPVTGAAQKSQAGFSVLALMLAIAGLGLMISLTACTSTQVQTAEQVACSTLPSLDVAFQAAILVHSVDAQVIVDEKTAMAGAVAACVPPYPTDVQTGAAKATQIVVAVANALAAAHSAPATLVTTGK